MEVIVSIDDSKLEEFKSLLNRLNAKVIDYPKDIVASSVKEVRQRVTEAEKRVKKGEYISESDFDSFIEKLLNENH
jgi:hypothetical protein